MFFFAPSKGIGNFLLEIGEKIYFLPFIWEHDPISGVKMGQKQPWDPDQDGSKLFANCQQMKKVAASKERVNRYLILYSGEVK